MICRTISLIFKRAKGRSNMADTKYLNKKVGRDDILVESPQSKVLDQITRISSEILEFFSLTCRKKSKIINHRTGMNHQ